MKKSPTYRFHVGSVGWDHDDWQGVFYPEDLPREWRLTFYNNAYSCVYLPYIDWSGREDAELSSWANDVMDRFRFVLEANPRGMSAEDLRKLAMVSSHLGVLADASGTVVPLGEREGRILWLEANPDLKKLAQVLLSHAKEPGEIFLISRDHDVDKMNRASTLLEVMGI